MVGVGGMGLIVSRALAQLWDDFDYVILDNTPSLGVLMVNALAAAQYLVIPVQTEFLAIKGLERMLHTLQMIMRSQKNELPIPSYLPCMIGDPGFGQEPESVAQDLSGHPVAVLHPG